MAILKVRQKKTGQTGQIDERGFNPQEYEILSVVDNKAPETKTVEQPQQKGLVASLLKPFTDTAKRVGEAGYQISLNPGALFGKADSAEQQKKRLEKPSRFMNIEDLERGKLVSDTARSTAGLASYAVPFGKGAGVKQLLTRGGLSGGLNAYSNKESIESGILTGGAGGVVGGKLLPKVLGFTKEAAKKSSIAEKVAAFGSRTRQNVGRAKIAASPYWAKTQTGIIKMKEKWGLTGDPQNQLQQMPEVADKMQTAIETRIAKNNVAIDQKKVNFKQRLTDLYEDIGDENVTHREVKREIKSQVTKFISQVKDLKSLYALKKRIGDTLSNVHKAKEDGNQITIHKDVKYATWNLLKDLIDETGDKTIREINSDQHALQQLAAGLIPEATGKTSFPLLGAAGAALRGPVKTLQDLVGRKAGAVANKTPAKVDPQGHIARLLQGTFEGNPGAKTQGLLNTLLPTQGTTTSLPAAASVFGQTLGSAGPKLEGGAITDDMLGQNLAPEVPAGSQDETRTGYTVEQLGAAWSSAVQAGDDATAKDLKAMYDVETAYQDKRSKTTSKSEAQVSREDSGDLVEEAIALFAANPDIATGMVGGKLTGLKSKFSKADPESLRFNVIISNLKAAIAKARAGTAFTPNEEALLNRYTPTVGDSKQELQVKLEELQRIDFKRRSTNQTSLPNIQELLPQLLGQ